MKRFYANTLKLLLFSFGVFSTPLWAAEDLLIFPEIKAVNINDNASTPSDIAATVDFFGTARYGQFRILGEVYFSEESIEAERLQFGYDFTPLTTAWIGRFHNPLGYWNTQYNHGTYLQTSITRPEIARLEHNGGIFPSHVSGLLLETSQPTNTNGTFDFTFTISTSPELRPATEDSTRGLILHPMNILKTSTGDHRLNLTTRLIYRPDTSVENQFGAFASQVEIASSEANIDSIFLSIAGLFAYWQKNEVNIFGSYFFAQDKIEYNTSTEDGSFSSGYIQLDYLMKSDWTLFARVEDTFGENNDPYLALMENFSPEAQVAGIRWDLTHRQAIKLEISQKELADDSFTTVILNWSAVYP